MDLKGTREGHDTILREETVGSERIVISIQVGLWY
jgi:hypothetical protein